MSRPSSLCLADNNRLTPSFHGIEVPAAVCSPPVPRWDLALCTELFAEVRQLVAATAEQVLNVSGRVCHVDELTPDLVKACNVSGLCATRAPKSARNANTNRAQSPLSRGVVIIRG